GRSPDCSTSVGSLQLPPPLLESWTRACSWLSLSAASDQPSAIVFGAPLPLGAPFAIAMLGKELVRAPAIPSNENERTPSKIPTSVTSATTLGLVTVFPPSNDLASLNTDCLWTMSSQTTKITPWLSVATAQPWRPSWVG